LVGDQVMTGDATLMLVKFLKGYFCEAGLRRMSLDSSSNTASRLRGLPHRSKHEIILWKTDVGEEDLERHELTCLNMPEDEYVRGVAAQLNESAINDWRWVSGSAKDPQPVTYCVSALDVEHDHRSNTYFTVFLGRSFSPPVEG
jgi:hypothetical protein